MCVLMMLKLLVLLCIVSTLVEKKHTLAYLKKENIK